MSSHKETEIKFKLNADTLEKLKYIQMSARAETDEYFFTRETLDKNIYLRFRKAGDKILLNLKRITVGSAESRDCYEADEIEAGLSEEQYNSMKAIFDVIFPIKWIVSKTRRKGMLDGCEVCHDSVEGLGEFIEIEGAREKVLELCGKLGLNPEDREQLGYVKLGMKTAGLL